MFMKWAVLSRRHETSVCVEKYFCEYGALEEGGGGGVLSDHYAVDFQGKSAVPSRSKMKFSLYFQARLQLR